MAIIELIKKDKKPIFEHGEKYGGSFYAKVWKIDKGGIFTCKSSYFIDKKDDKGVIVKDSKTGKPLKEMITKILEFLIEEELVFLNIDGERVFPIIEEEKDVTFESEFN